MHCGSFLLGEPDRPWSQAGTIQGWTPVWCWRRVMQWWAHGWERCATVTMRSAHSYRSRTSAQTLSLGPRWLLNGSPVHNLNRWEGNRQGFLVQLLIQYEKCTTVTHLEALQFPSDGRVDFNYLCMTDMKWEYSCCHTLHDWLQCPQRVRKLQLTF